MITEKATSSQTLSLTHWQTISGELCLDVLPLRPSPRKVYHNWECIWDHMSSPQTQTSHFDVQIQALISTAGIIVDLLITNTHCHQPHIMTSTSWSTPRLLPLPTHWKGHQQSTKTNRSQSNVILLQLFWFQVIKFFFLYDICLVIWIMLSR